jgi:hypothetical protein
VQVLVENRCEFSQMCDEGTVDLIGFFRYGSDGFDSGNRLLVSESPVGVRSCPYINPGVPFALLQGNKIPEFRDSFVSNLLTKHALVR